jgi:site-specific DNA-methyltransferase (adenine-specific)
VIQLHCGNSLDVLATLGSNSVDSIITDPPYGLSFMGRKWDYDVPSKEIWEQCLRVLKPGGHLLAFAGTRTQHRMAVNIEDAGFEIRDMIMWCYGSGFPKSQNVGKAMDKAAGVEGKRGPMKRGGERLARLADGKRDGEGRWGDEVGRDPYTYVPATPEAQQWDGWGTALKPALEPITVARKPFKGTVANNVLEHGTGAINIDGCRVTCDPADFGDPSRFQGARKGNDSWDRQDKGMLDAGRSGGWANGVPSGRWPANLIHDGSDEVTELFPETAPSRAGLRRNRSGMGIHDSEAGTFGKGDVFGGFNDSGSAARFFYCPKANKKDREDGNTHPTVKPTDLMAYLCRLVTPPSGIILDPFMGSGSTGKAAVREGFNFIGIDKEEEYVAIASKRLHVIQRSILASRSADQNGWHLNHSRHG